MLEREQKLGTPAAGLRVPPNMSKILKRWIGEDKLFEHAIFNLETPWYDRESCILRFATAASLIRVVQYTQESILVRPNGGGM